MDMKQIEELTQQYARSREVLAGRVQQLEDDTEALRRRKLPGIKRAVADAAAARDALANAVDGNPQLFKRPRTVTLHGIRVGITKGRGVIKWDDPDRVVSLIRKHLPEQADTLVKTKESPVKSALNQLSTAELRRIGVTVVEAGDEVVIKPVDSAVDKLVDALLRDSAEELDAVA